MTGSNDGFGGRGLSRELPDPQEYLREQALKAQVAPEPSPPPPPQETPQMRVAAEPVQARTVARPERMPAGVVESARPLSQRELLRKELSSRRALQRAFLLIEVLGPPKALRDPDEG
ncbi:hypothetical protein [Deinococcus peraridilitoris]|uniref:Uncharacterized protein n=1 Tax=Deinococcus peraridilitoris (strain DSM 19664 / LMG 22246 / CIP 109416 / KR-200) TaxID=937777 RepID=L0A4L4_DEIPD|nr:hypothetical protein [Deinococcus peraridilitoris]AFZ68097.1 hypothetical protein Deipe_2632 [Deinococcus peraridilitoris DSM 19664]